MREEVTAARTSDVVCLSTMIAAMAQALGHPHDQLRPTVAPTRSA